MSPAQAAAAARDAAPARAPGPRRPKVVPVREAEVRPGRITRLVGALNLGNQLGRIGTLAAVALFLSVFGVVIFQTLIVQGQARLDNLNSQAAVEDQRSRDLHQQVADLEAPSRIVGAAKDRLGMVAPGSVVYLSPSATDGDKSTYVAPPPTTPPATKPKSTAKKSTTATTPTTTAPKSTTTTAPRTTTTTKPKVATP
jgi:cell division protein FtsL